MSLIRDPTEILRTIAQSSLALGTELDAQGVVEIVGRNLDSSLSFYDAIGFCIERRTGPFAVVNGFGVRIFLAENAEASTQSRWANVRILVSDVDVVWECVRALGLPIVNEIGDRPYGIRDFVFRDPSGFEIRFAQLIGTQNNASSSANA